MYIFFRNEEPSSLLPEKGETNIKIEKTRMNINALYCLVPVPTQDFAIPCIHIVLVPLRFPSPFLSLQQPVLNGFLVEMPSLPTRTLLGYFPALPVSTPNPIRLN